MNKMEPICVQVLLHRVDPAQFASERAQSQGTKMKAKAKKIKEKKDKYWRNFSLSLPLLLRCE